MRDEGLCAEDDYIQICIEGVSKIDTTKLSRFNADDWSVRVAYFIEINNKHDMKFEFNPSKFDFLLEGGTIAKIDQFVFYHDLHFPDGWQAVSESILPNESVKLLVIPEEQVGDQKPQSIGYEQKLAEAWYDSIKSDSDEEIINYSGKQIQVKLTPSMKHWRQIKMNMR